MKTVAEVIDEYRKRMYPKIKILIVDTANGTHTYNNVTNYKRLFLSGTTKFSFDTLDSHITIYGNLILKEEEL